MAVGILLTVGLYLYLHSANGVIKAGEDERGAAAAVGDIQRDLRQRLFVLHSVGSLIDSGEAADGNFFRELSGRMTDFFPGLVSVAWVPVGDRTSSQSFFLMTGGGESLTGSGIPDGLSAVALAVAARGNGLTVAGRRELSFLLPVHGEGKPATAPFERRGNAIAILAVTVTTADFLHSVLNARTSLSRFQTAVYGGARDRLLHIHPPDTPDGGLRAGPPESWDDALPRRVLEVGGERWHLLFRPLPDALGRDHRSVEIALLVLGLLGTLLVTSFVAGVSARDRRLSDLAATFGEANHLLRYEVQARMAAEAALHRLNERLLGEIAERQEAERALRESDDLFRRALAPSPVVVFSHDRQLRYTWLHNGGPAEGPEAAIGKTDEELFGPADASMLTGLKSEVLHGGIAVRRQVRLQGEGGREGEIIIEPIFDRKGSISGIVGTFIDVTELNAARAEAERANAAKSRFLAAASHDLRQPLVAMRLFHELLTEKLTSEEQRNLALRMGGSLAAAEGLLESLMDVSALESGKVRPRATTFQLRVLVNRIADECQAEAQAKNLVLRTHHCRRSSCTGCVFADPVLLARMLRNLISNAIRYTPKGQVMIACRCRGEAFRIEVWDTGVGIAGEQLSQIFEDFYQIDSGVGGGPGLGLGLSTVARMARLLGYKIEVKSRLGLGSVFSIIVPRQPPGTEPAAATATDSYESL